MHALVHRRRAYRRAHEAGRAGETIAPDSMGQTAGTPDPARLCVTRGWFDRAVLVCQHARRALR
jgi:hypothetical protein